MAAAAWKFYNEAKKYLMTADLDLDGTLLRIKLAKGTAAANVSDFTRSTFASITGAPSNLVANILSMTGNVVTSGVTAKATKFDDTNDYIWTASGGTATSILYAVIGVSGGKCLCWTKLSAVTSVTSGNTLTLAFNASGIFTLTGGVT